jgi:hypothetical protein
MAYASATLQGDKGVDMGQMREVEEALWIALGIV